MSYDSHAKSLLKSRDAPGQSSLSRFVLIILISTTYRGFVRMSVIRFLFFHVLRILLLWIRDSSCVRPLFVPTSDTVLLFGIFELLNKRALRAVSGDQISNYDELLERVRQCSLNDQHI